MLRIHAADACDCGTSIVGSACCEVGWLPSHPCHDSHLTATHSHTTTQPHTAHQGTHRHTVTHSHTAIHSHTQPYTAPARHTPPCSEKMTALGGTRTTTRSHRLNRTIKSRDTTSSRGFDPENPAITMSLTPPSYYLPAIATTR